MSEVSKAGFRFPAGARNYWRPGPGPTRDVSDPDAEIPARPPPPVQARAGLIPAPTDSRALVTLPNDTSPELTEGLAPSAADPTMSGQPLDSHVRRLEDRINAAERLSEARLDARFARLEDRINAAERLSEARLDARFARLEASLERALQAQTAVLRDLTAKLEFLGARQADADAAAKGLAAQFEMIRAERNEDRRAARKRHIRVIVAIVTAAVAMAAAVVGLGQFSFGAVQIGATLPAPSPKDPVAKFREQAEAQIPVQAPTPAPAQAPTSVRSPDQPEPAKAQTPVQVPPAPAQALTPVPAPDQAEQAAVQTPVPSPPAPHTVERAVPRADLAAVSAAATAAADCGLVAAAPTADGISVSGVVRRGEEEAIRGMLNAFGVASAAPQFNLQAFDAPYCDALEAMRLDAAAPGAAPHLSLASPNPLPKGQKLQFRVEMPDWASHLTVTYLTVSGDAGHLVNGAAVQSGGTLTFADPLWVAVGPFGTELLVAVASDRPLFVQRRRTVERQADYAPALAAALRAMREEGKRAAVRVIVVETAER